MLFSEGSSTNRGEAVDRQADLRKLYLDKADPVMGCNKTNPAASSQLFSLVTTSSSLLACSTCLLTALPASITSTFSTSLHILDVRSLLLGALLNVSAFTLGRSWWTRHSLKNPSLARVLRVLQPF